MAAGLERAATVACPAVFLEGSPSYYGARGFERAGGCGFTRPSLRIPDVAFQVALPDAQEDWMSGALVYCNRFWTQDCVGLRLVD